MTQRRVNITVSGTPEQFSMAAHHLEKAAKTFTPFLHLLQEGIHKDMLDAWKANAAFLRMLAGQFR